VTATEIQSFAVHDDPRIYLACPLTCLTENTARRRQINSDIAAAKRAIDAVTVGDTRFDIEAAKKAGLKTIAFLCGGTPESLLREAGAIAIYRDPVGFLAHYDELMK